MARNSYHTRDSKELITIWEQGKDIWNAWRRPLGEFNCDFSSFDFNKYLPNGVNIDFAYFEFPTGEVNFNNAKFGNRKINFNNTKFGNGDFHFSGAAGKISFFNANFGSGNKVFSGKISESKNVDFNKVIFGDGDVDFSSASFGAGIVNFSKTNFGAGTKDFSTDFGQGSVLFSDSNFGNGDVKFKEAKFENGNVTFLNSSFGKGDVDFAAAKFGKGEINFSNIDFGHGNVIFSNVDFGHGNVIFSKTKFNGMALFTNLSSLKDIKSFSFKYATFDGPLDISCAEGEVFPCLVDLTHTKTSHHVSVSGLNCTLPRKSICNYFAKKRRWLYRYGVKYIPCKCMRLNILRLIFIIFPNGDWASKKVAIDQADIDRARRLKELAEANKDHNKAKEFHILEMQASRDFKPSCCIFSAYSFLLKSEFWYEKLSDYGRGILRPLFWLIGVAFLGAFVYLLASPFKIGFKTFLQSLGFSFSQMFAFIPSSRSARENLGNSLFCSSGQDCPIPEWIYFFTFSQSLFTFILLFLLGLGLRHRYRI
tara:strand:- start:1170 stop:2777 length:1608 start_codon:yes stop_codon:yes gene_type:complete